MHALHRVGTVQRLVEHEHAWIADQRGGDLGALAHALAERRHAAVGHVEQTDGAQRLVRRATIGHAVEVGDVAHQLAGREAAGHGLVLGDQTDGRLHVAIAARVATVDVAPCLG